MQDLYNDLQASISDIEDHIENEIENLMYTHSDKTVHDFKRVMRSERALTGDVRRIVVEAIDKKLADLIDDKVVGSKQQD